MKKFVPEWGMIHRSMTGYRRKFLVIEILLIVFWVWYLLACREYIFNAFEGAVELNQTQFVSEAECIEVGEEFELHRSDDRTIKDYALRPDSYWQGEKYEFLVKPGNIQKTSVKYTNATTQTGDDSDAEDISAHLYIADINGIDVLVLAYPHQNLVTGQSVKGIFTEIPLIVSHDIAASEDFEANDKVCKYMLDLRGIEMESENFDLLFVSVLLGIILFLAFKLIRQFVNYLHTPTYSQLTKYGNPLEVEKMVESEFEDAEIKNNSIITDNWILSRDTFKLKIVKNHMKHGNFRYTPEKFN